MNQSKVSIAVDMALDEMEYQREAREEIARHNAKQSARPKGIFSTLTSKIRAALWV
jgi:hypothetical protein